ncbi:hypothetical protein ACHAPU_001258 [Fusarium lateritium]
MNSDHQNQGGNVERRPDYCCSSQGENHDTVEYEETFHDEFDKRFEDAEDDFYDDDDDEVFYLNLVDPKKSGYMSTVKRVPERVTERVVEKSDEGVAEKDDERVAEKDDERVDENGYHVCQHMWCDHRDEDGWDPEDEDDDDDESWMWDNLSGSCY